MYQIASSGSDWGDRVRSWSIGVHGRTFLSEILVQELCENIAKIMRKLTRVLSKKQSERKSEDVDHRDTRRGSWCSYDGVRILGNYAQL